MKDKEIKLKMPLINQPVDKDYCALACVEMISSYFKRPLSMEFLTQELSSILNNKNVGITPASARVMAENGFKVQLWTRQLELMTPNIIDNHYKDYSQLEIVLEKDKKYFTENAQQQWKEFLKFVKIGGVLSTHLPSIVDIDNILNEGIPVRLGVAPKALHPESQFNNHALIVTGLREDEYFINDPSVRFLEPYTVRKNELLFAWYSRGAVMFTARPER